MNFSKNPKKGFTLVEILVVITILGLLTTLAAASLQGIKISGRDTKRVSDINTIRNALNLYYQKYSSYPTAITPGQAFSVNGVTYLETVPSNPQPWNEANCSSADSDAYLDYTYLQTDSGLSYTLTFCLGYQNGSLPAGTLKAIPEGIVQ